VGSFGRFYETPVKKLVLSASMAAGLHAQQALLPNAVTPSNTYQHDHQAVYYEDEPSRSQKAFLWSSVAYIIAGQSMDIATSLGHSEANGVLANKSGQFGGAGLAIKAGITGALVATDVLLRHRGSLYMPLAVSNLAFGSVGVFAAVHNLHVEVK
jgi:hypothetical protein